MKNPSFIKEVAKMGEDLVIKVPRELRDLFKGKRVTVSLFKSNEEVADGG